MTYAESLGVIPQAIAIVLVIRVLPDQPDVFRIPCHSAEEIVSTVSHARPTDSVKVQVLS